MTPAADNDRATIEHVLELNRRLLVAIADGDWNTYAELCDPTLTAFEPEARGHLVEGMEFHHFYFGLGGICRPAQHDDQQPARSARRRRGGRLLRAAGAAAR